MRRLFILLGVAVSFSMFTGCSKDGGINLFTLQQDVAFGRQLDSSVMANPAEYKILDKATHPKAYEHLERVRDAILNSGLITYKTEFEWQVKIIDNDEVLNAFAAPGGYMYFYTGLIKYLDNESQFAGVMAHEMAHADKRHSTQTMTKTYGFDVMLGMLLGDKPSVMADVLGQMAKGATSLKFSRTHEYQADEFAVKYLNATKDNSNYAPREVAGFFEKLTAAGQSGKTPEFLSTHPSPENRISEIERIWKELGSKAGETYVDRYKEFKASVSK